VIRVLIVDDHAVVRSGLRRLLDAEADIETVGEAPNADRAVFEAIEGAPDVVLMDLVMPEKGGIEGMPAVLQAVPDVKVLVLSMQDDPSYVREAFAVGAFGYGFFFFFGASWAASRRKISNRVGSPSARNAATIRSRSVSTR